MQYSLLLNGVSIQVIENIFPPPINQSPEKKQKRRGKLEALKYFGDLNTQSFELAINDRPSLNLLTLKLSEN